MKQDLPPKLTSWIEKQTPHAAVGWLPLLNGALGVTNTVALPQGLFSTQPRTIWALLVLFWQQGNMQGKSWALGPDPVDTYSGDLHTWKCEVWDIFEVLVTCRGLRVRDNSTTSPSFELLGEGIRVGKSFKYSNFLSMGSNQLSHTWKMKSRTANGYLNFCNLWDTRRRCWWWWESGRWGVLVRYKGRV